MKATLYVAAVVVVVIAAALMFVLPTNTPAVNFAIDRFDAQSNSVIVRNTGTSPISYFDVYVDGTRVDSTTEVVAPGSLGQVFLKEALTAGSHSIEVRSGGYEAQATASVPESWVADFTITAE